MRNLKPALILLAALASLAIILSLTGCNRGANPSTPTPPIVAASEGARTSPTPLPENTFRVWKVTDGDTIHVVPAAAQPGVHTPDTDVRIIGINTPESYGALAPQCWSAEASKLAKDVLQGRLVVLSKDSTQAEVDRFGRALRYVDVIDKDNPLPDYPQFPAPQTDYSTFAAYSGTAHSFPYDGKPGIRAEAIARAETDAKNAHRGMWGPPCNGDTSTKTAKPSPTR